MFEIYWPIALIVLSNTFYHICSKSTPRNVNPLASLTATYLIATVFSGALYFILNRGGNLLAEYRHLNWTTASLGLAIVGLECGNLYMYKVGWSISTGQMVQSSILAVILIFVGFLVYREQIPLTRIIGIFVCLFGLYLINK